MECPNCHFPDNVDNAESCINCGYSFVSPKRIVDEDETIDYTFGPGKEFENFKVIEQIGSGGHGDVYKVEELSTGKIWALKALTSIKRKSIPRFQQEFRVLSSLEHENIVKVHKYGRYGEMHYYVMELVNGIDMRKFIRENVDVASILQGNEEKQKRFIHILEQICSALNYIHNENIIHRDIKPSNILITKEDKVKLMDFGLIKEKNIQSHLTATGIILGSASYMAPEQCLGQKVDFSSDLYSLGTILFEIFCGKLPFTGTSMIEIISKKSKGMVPSPQGINPAIPERLGRVLLKMLARNQKDRYLTASHFLTDMKKALNELQKPNVEDEKTSTSPTLTSLKKSKEESMIPDVEELDSEVTVKRYFEEMSHLDPNIEPDFRTKTTQILKKNRALISFLSLLTIGTIIISFIVFAQMQKKSRKKQIILLTQKAQLCFEQNKLTSPKDDNAYELYKKILELDPKNSGAIEGIEKIKTVYFSWANALYQKGRYERAFLYYDKILLIDSDNGEASNKIKEIRKILKTKRKK